MKRAVKYFLNIIFNPLEIRHDNYRVTLPYHDLGKEKEIEGGVGLPQRYIQNRVKYLRWSVLQNVNSF